MRRGCAVFQKENPQFSSLTQSRGQTLPLPPGLCFLPTSVPFPRRGHRGREPPGLVLRGGRRESDQEGEAPPPRGTHACDGGQAAGVQGDAVGGYQEGAPGSLGRGPSRARLCSSHLGGRWSEARGCLSGAGAGPSSEAPRSGPAAQVWQLCARRWAARLPRGHNWRPPGGPKHGARSWLKQTPSGVAFRQCRCTVDSSAAAGVHTDCGGLWVCLSHFGPWPTLSPGTRASLELPQPMGTIPAGRTCSPGEARALLVWPQPRAAAARGTLRCCF